MPAPSEFLFEDTFTEDDWIEAIAPTGTPSETISRERATFTVTITKIPFAKYKSAIKFILGYSYSDNVNPKIIRITPAFHPKFPWAFATRITQTMFHQPANLNAAAEGGANPLLASYWETGISTMPYDGAVPYGVYKYASITVEFEHLPYPIFEDDDVANETERYVQILYMPYTEFVEVKGGRLTRKFEPNAGQAYISAPYVLQALRKTKVKIIWYEVPAEFIENATTKLQTNLSAIQKKVNSVTFLNYTPGTLFCEYVETEKYVMPVATEALDRKQYHYKVTFHCIHHDPSPRGVNEVKFGHNLLPVEQGKWQEFIDQQGNNLVGEYDFYDAFELVV